MNIFYFCARCLCEIAGGLLSSDLARFLLLPRDFDFRP